MDRTLYDFVDARELAQIELDSHPKDETHPFWDLPASLGRHSDPRQQALRLQEEYVERRSKEMTPRKPLPEKAAERLTMRRKIPLIRDAYRIKVAADTYKNRGDEELADALYLQEQELLERAEEVV